MMMLLQSKLLYQTGRFDIHTIQEATKALRDLVQIDENRKTVIMAQREFQLPACAVLLADGDISLGKIEIVLSVPALDTPLPAMFNLNDISNSVIDRYSTMWNVNIVVDQTDTWLHIINRHFHAARIIFDLANRTARRRMGNGYIFPHQMLLQL